MKLTGRTMLITGGTGGIGLEFARRFAAMGNRVIVTGRNQAKLDELRREGFVAIRSDAGDRDAIIALHREVKAQGHAVDMLINNAGIMRNIHVVHGGKDELASEIEINLLGPIWMVEAFLPDLLACDNAAIVNVSSALAFVPFPAAPVYSASKAGLHAYTEVLRVQLRGTKVAVIEIAPPGTDTPLLQGDFEKGMKDFKPMPVDKMVDAAIAGLKKGKTLILPGQASIMHAMSRIAPRLMLNQLAKIS